MKFIRDRVMKELYLQDPLCKKKITEAVHMVIKNEDGANRKLENFRQVGFLISFFHKYCTKYDLVDSFDRTNVPYPIKIHQTKIF